MSSRWRPGREPQILPAPFALWCPACGDEIDEDDPVAEVRVEGVRQTFLVCQGCACGDQAGV